MADFKRGSNLSLEEHAARMEKLDPSPAEKAQKNGLKERASQWLHKMTRRGEKQETAVQSPEEVAKTKKIERVLRPLLYDVSAVDSFQKLEEIRNNPGKSIREYDERTLNVRNNSSASSRNKPVRPTVSEQLTSEEKRQAEDILSKTVQQKIVESLLRLGNQYLESIQERKRRDSSWNLPDNMRRTDLIYFLGNSNEAVHLRKEDGSFMPFEDQILKALGKNAPRLSPDAFDYLRF